MELLAALLSIIGSVLVIVSWQRRWRSETMSLFSVDPEFARRLRKGHETRLSVFAAGANLDEKTVKKIEKGELVRQSSIECYAAALKVEVSDLVRDDTSEYRDISSDNLARLSDAASESRRAYEKRASDYSLRHAKCDLGPFSVSPASPVPKQCSIDCICGAVSNDGNVCLVIPSGKSEPSLEGIGRTAVIHHLLGFSPPYTQVIAGATEVILDFPDEGRKLIASDMAFLSRINSELCVTPIVGEKINFVWDLARHLYRSTDIMYEPGAHRSATNRSSLLQLFESLNPKGIEKIYTGTAAGPRAVNEIVVLKREAGPPGMRIRDLRLRDDVLSTLIDSISVSSERHGSTFWQRPEQMTREAARRLLDEAKVDQIRVRELVLTSQYGGDVPQYLYEQAAAAIKCVPHVEPQITEASVIRGIDAYTERVFRALSSTRRLRLLATSGEKLFRDGAFWRCLQNVGASVELEVLLLDPKSKYVGELQKTSYSDKPKGFLRREIQANIETLTNIRKRLAQVGSPIELKLGLYRDRTPLRITLIGEERAILSIYARGVRTGRETLFFDIRGSDARDFEQEFERIRKSSVPVQE